MPRNTFLIIGVVLALVAFFALWLLTTKSSYQSMSYNVPPSGNITPTSDIIPSKKCVIAGCNGELCIDEEVNEGFSTCKWLDEYVCYKEPYAKCEVQGNGKCGWTQNEELTSCLKNYN